LLFPVRQAFRAGSSPRLFPAAARRALLRTLDVRGGLLRAETDGDGARGHPACPPDLPENLGKHPGFADLHDEAWRARRCLLNLTRIPKKRFVADLVAARDGHRPGSRDCHSEGGAPRHRPLATGSWRRPRNLVAATRGQPRAEEPRTPTPPCLGDELRSTDSRFLGWRQGVSWQRVERGASLGMTYVRFACNQIDQDPKKKASPGVDGGKGRTTPPFSRSTAGEARIRPGSRAESGRTRRPPSGPRPPRRSRWPGGLA
jgi:hypothetical protein